MMIDPTDISVWISEVWKISPDLGRALRDVFNSVFN